MLLSQNQEDAIPAFSCVFIYPEGLHLLLLPLPILVYRAQVTLPSTGGVPWGDTTWSRQWGISQTNALWLPSASVSFGKNTLCHGKTKAEG